MAKRISAERREQRKKLLEMLEGAGITDVAGVQELFKEMVGTVLESGLEGELEEELGYSKYDFRNKETESSRNGHSEKTLKSSLGEIEIQVPRDRKSEFDPQLVKKHQTSLHDVYVEEYGSFGLRYDVGSGQLYHNNKLGAVF